jgi:hypothetical protein
MTGKNLDFEMGDLLGRLQKLNKYTISRQGFMGRKLEEDE